MGLYGMKRIAYRSRNLPEPEGMERMAHTLWTEMIDGCFSKAIDKEVRIKNNVSSRFKTYSFFWHWFRGQPCSDLQHVALNKDLLYRHNRVYSDATCVLLPKQIHSVLKECRVTRSDLEALKVELGSSVLPGDENSVEVAFLAAKAELEETLRSLAEYYRDSLDPRAYRALCSYEVTISEEAEQ